MHLSHSTPTSMRFTTATTATRSLWIGNIDASITVDLLTQTFAPYGPIESVRLLMEKECAFVNYFYVDHAVRAKEDLLGPLGGRIGHCVVRIGYGRTDATNEPTIAPSPPPQAASPPPQQDQQVTHQATRALCKSFSFLGIYLFTHSPPPLSLFQLSNRAWQHPSRHHFHCP